MPYPNGPNRGTKVYSFFHGRSETGQPIEEVFTYPNRDARVRDEPGGALISSSRDYAASVLRRWRSRTRVKLGLDTIETTRYMGR